MTTSEAVDKAAAIYSSKGWLRAIVAAVPFVGGSIDALVTSRGTELAQQRVTALLDDLRAGLQRVTEAKVDQSFISSEAWDDLVMRAFRTAADTRDRDKIRFLAAVLTGSVTLDDGAGLDAESLLGVIADLSPADLAFARALYARMTGPRSAEESVMGEIVYWGVRTGSWEWVPSAAGNDIVFRLKRLERVGLIEEITGAFFDYGGGAYRLTPTFARLMDTATRYSAHSGAPETS